MTLQNEKKNSYPPLQNVLVRMSALTLYCLYQEREKKEADIETDRYIDRETKGGGGDKWREGESEREKGRARTLNFS